MDNQISDQDLKKLIDNNVSLLLIDVRTPEEYMEGHIPKSKNIPLQEFEDIIKNMNLKLNTLIIVYCKSGIRAAKAYNILKKFGFKKVYNLGGIYNWHYKLEN